MFLAEPELERSGMCAIIGCFLAVFLMARLAAAAASHFIPGYGWALDTGVESLILLLFVYFWMRRESSRRLRWEERCRRNYQTEMLINELRDFSLKDVSLDEILGLVLDRVFQVSWLRLEPKGGVFLADEQARSLSLLVHRGMDELLPACASIPFDGCLCGRAAESCRMSFGEDVVETGRSEGIAMHGHYCVPIKSSTRVFGLMVFFADVGHACNDEEAMFLNSVAGLLAGVIERCLLERQLRQAQKIDAVGLLAGGVAHDFNNMLTLMMGYTEILSERLPSQDPLQSFLRSIRKAVDGAAAMTRQLLTFSGGQKIGMRVLDLNAAVSGTGRMLRRLVGEHIAFDIRLHSQVCPVRADSSHLDQIVLNLVVNARDAMPQGGTLDLETRIEKVPTRCTRGARPELLAGCYVVLQVSDTGMGMDEGTRARLFEPFFSTKGPGRGTGLGLSTVQGIVRQCGGHIFVESSPGQGSVFSVYFPLAEGPVEEARPRPIGAKCGDGEQILFVEDDGRLCELMERVLRQAGYRVVSACDGIEALLVLERHPGELHLLITDVLLPRMNGLDLARRVLEVSPSTRVLYTSGSMSEGGRELFPPDAQFLGKPFSREDLLSAVRRAVDVPRAQTSKIG
ncbi:MAG: ATP-binding protein [Elusimicrobiota bacterium]